MDKSAKATAYVELDVGAGIIHGMEEDLAAHIRNACWWVRHYHRNDQLRAQAILKLGLSVRHAFNQSEDFELLLTALIDGLSPVERRPF